MENTVCVLKTILYGSDQERSPKYRAYYFGGNNPLTNWIVIGPNGPCSRTTSQAGAEAKAVRMNEVA